MVTHVVFDLGKVLVDFSYAQLFPQLRRRGARIRDIDDFVEQVGLADYEHGRISTSDFLSRVNALLSAPIEEAALAALWCDIFTPLPQMFSLARRLRPLAQVCILSNTGEVHWRYLKERFRLDDLCDDSLASCEAGLMKPTSAIYAQAAERFGFAPQNAVFIDDRLENVEGARACNWQAIQHQSYGQTRDALRELGIYIRE